MPTLLLTGETIDSRMLGSTRREILFCVQATCSTVVGTPRNVSRAMGAGAVSRNGWAWSRWSARWSRRSSTRRPPAGTRRHVSHRFGLRLRMEDGAHTAPARRQDGWGGGSTRGSSMHEEGGNRHEEGAAGARDHWRGQGTTRASSKHFCHRTALPRGSGSGSARAGVEWATCGRGTYVCHSFKTRKSGQKGSHTLLAPAPAPPPLHRASPQRTGAAGPDSVCSRSWEIGPQARVADTTEGTARCCTWHGRPSLGVPICGACACYRRVESRRLLSSRVCVVHFSLLVPRALERTKYRHLQKNTLRVLRSQSPSVWEAAKPLGHCSRARGRHLPRPRTRRPQALSSPPRCLAAPAARNTQHATAGSGNPVLVLARRCGDSEPRGRGAIHAQRLRSVTHRKQGGEGTQSGGAAGAGGKQFLDNHLAASLSNPRQTGRTLDSTAGQTQRSVHLLSGMRATRDAMVTARP